MAFGQNADEGTSEGTANNLPNHATQMNKKLKQAANVIEGLRAKPAQHVQPEQPAQPAQAPQPAQVTNAEIERYQVPNPPVVILTNGTNIQMCKGCGKAITFHDKQYLHNMVFTRRGITGYLNRKKDIYIKKISNIHFHLHLKCLWAHDHTVKL